MGRKHGFRGTPVRPPRGPSTVGRVFEQRGDPMVSAREGREKYGRNLETEDPDFDRYFAEDRLKDERVRRLASELLKPHQVDKGESFRKSLASRPSAQQLATNIIRRRRLAHCAKVVNIKEPHRDEPVDKDNIPARVLGHDEGPSREKQTPINASKRSYYLFTKTDAPLPELKKLKRKRKKK